MLRKNSFHWTEEAITAFAALKSALTSTPILALPNFELMFVLECDASETGIGAVLLQESKPVAFFSRALAARHTKLPAYERELIGLVKAIKHWQSYLWGKIFLVRTDHYTLKFLLEQRSLSSSQQHWLSKLLPFDFTVEYKAGKSNTVADALSRRDADQQCLLALSMPQVDLFDDIRQEQQQSPKIQQLIAALHDNSAAPNWSFKQGLLFFKDRVYIHPQSPSIPLVMAAIHNQGHEGYQKTLHRLTRDFFWKGMKKMVREFIQGCDVCQRHKTANLQPAGLLQPLPVPQQIWADVSLDFIEGLPSSRGKNVILVVIDRFSKYGHFVAISHPYTAISIARIFFDNIFKLHGLPETMVSDRDVTFTSSFWKELFRLCGTKLCFSSAYHPQSDGQTEVTNRTVEMYLRCFTSSTPHKWCDWLSWAEFCYNTSYHSSLKSTPFETVYGRAPPRLLSYLPGSSAVEAVDVILQQRDSMLQQLRHNLFAAQNRMKTQYDRSHRMLEFNVGDFVLLRLQPYRQSSLAARKNQKLAAKYYGPFEVLDRIGSMAYRLKLPPDSKIHPVFHVSTLKPYHASSGSFETVLPPTPEQQPSVPLAVLGQRTRAGKLEVLVHWSHASPADSSWESVQELRARYPNFQLEDKLLKGAGSIVTSPIQVYTRKQKKQQPRLMIIEEMD